jgi:hypothetical protein
MNKCRKINFIKPVGTRRRGRPSVMWSDSIKQDTQILVIETWRTTGTTGVAELR